MSLLSAKQQARWTHPARDNFEQLTPDIHCENVGDIGLGPARASSTVKKSSPAGQMNDRPVHTFAGSKTASPSGLDDYIVHLGV